MAPHSSTRAWKIPWTEEPGRLQSMGSLRIGHDWATSLSLFTFMHWRRNWQPTPVFLPGESQGRDAWWAAVYGVAQSWTRLKQLSSSSFCLWIFFILPGKEEITDNHIAWEIPRYRYLQDAVGDIASTLDRHQENWSNCAWAQAFLCGCGFF